MKTVKKILRAIKRLMIKVFGTKTDELYWRFRHAFDKSWTKSYISQTSINDAHRRPLIEKISNFAPFESILEFGCASGPNLYLLAQRFPETQLYGIDISEKAIEEGERYFAESNIGNVSLSATSEKSLSNFKDKSIDVVFTDAVLIYFGKDKIEDAIRHLLRIAKKGIVLLELHHWGNKSIYQDNWVHNYQNIFEAFIDKEKIKITKLPKNMWGGNWDEYGHIIEVKL